MQYLIETWDTKLFLVGPQRFHWRLKHAGKVIAYSNQSHSRRVDRDDVVRRLKDAFQPGACEVVGVEG
jgi:hypothetical protein